MSKGNLLAAAFGMSRHWLNPSHATDDLDSERARAKLRNRFLFDEHLLRDMGFREKASRCHHTRFPGF